MGELEYYVIAPDEGVFPATDQKGYHESAPYAKFNEFRTQCMAYIAQAGGQIKCLLGIGMPLSSVRAGADGIHNPADAEYGIKRTAEMIDQINNMRTQIKQNTAAADIPILLPSRGLGGIRRTAVVIRPAETDDPPQAAVVDQLLGAHNGQKKSVIEDYTGRHAHLIRQAGHLPRLLFGHTEGLFAIDMFFRAECFLQRLVVVNIRGADIDHIDIGGGDQFVLILRRHGKAVSLRRGPGVFGIPGTNTVNAGGKGQIPIEERQIGHCVGVGTPHTSESEQSDTHTIPPIYRHSLVFYHKNADIARHCLAYFPMDRKKKQILPVSCRTPIHAPVVSLPVRCTK